MSSLWLHSNHMKVIKTEPCTMCQKRKKEKKKKHTILSFFSYSKAECLLCSTSIYQPTQILHSFGSQKGGGRGVMEEGLVRSGLLVENLCSPKLPPIALINRVQAGHGTMTQCENTTIPPLCTRGSVEAITRYCINQLSLRFLPLLFCLYLQRFILG